MLDQADLDFGIYRIMNQKRDQIESYLNNDLRWQVTETIRENASNDAEAVKKELTQLVATLTAAGMNPDDAPKVKELKEMKLREQEVNAFDIGTSQGMLQVAEASTAAIMKQLALDENDYTEMISTQRQKLLELENKCDAAIEEARILRRENDDLKNFLRDKKLIDENDEVIVE